MLVVVVVVSPLLLGAASLAAFASPVADLRHKCPEGACVSPYRANVITHLAAVEGGEATAKTESPCENARHNSKTSVSPAPFTCLTPSQESERGKRGWQACANAYANANVSANANT